MKIPFCNCTNTCSNVLIRSADLPLAGLLHYCVFLVVFDAAAAAVVFFFIFFLWGAGYKLMHVTFS